MPRYSSHGWDTDMLNMTRREYRATLRPVDPWASNRDVQRFDARERNAERARNLENNPDR